MDTPATDYLSLNTRLIALATASPDDRKSMVAHLHAELKAALVTVGGVAYESIAKLFERNKTPLPDGFAEEVPRLVTSAVADGYFAYLATRGIDPSDGDLEQKQGTEQIGNIWISSQEKDGHLAYINRIDPIVMLFLNQLYELRANQLLTAYPRLIDLPYQTTEGVNGYIRWSVVMGYILGMMEGEIRDGGERV